MTTPAPSAPDDYSIYACAGGVIVPITSDTRAALVLGTPVTAPSLYEADFDFSQDSEQLKDGKGAILEEQYSDAIGVVTAKFRRVSHKVVAAFYNYEIVTSVAGETRIKRAANSRGKYVHLILVSQASTGEGSNVTVEVFKCRPNVQMPVGLKAEGFFDSFEIPMTAYTRVHDGEWIDDVYHDEAQTLDEIAAAIVVATAA